MELVVNDYEQIRAKLKIQKNLIVVTSENDHLLYRFVNVITANPEQCYVLGEKEHLISLAQSKVDYIDEEFAKTTLTIEEYLNFFGLASGIFSDMYMTEIKEFIEKYGLETYREVPICELDERSKLLVRLFITTKKNVRFILFNNVGGVFSDKDLYGIIRNFKLFCREYDKICIIVTHTTELINRYQGEIYYI